MDLKIILLYILILHSISAITRKKNQFPFNALLVLPSKESEFDHFRLTIDKALPVIDIAIDDAVGQGYVPKGFLNVTTHDSRYWQDISLAERYAVQGVVQAYTENRLDVIFGFADFYSLATVAKVTPALGDGVPVLTTAGMISQLGSKKIYPYLIRMQGSITQMADSVYQLVAYQDSTTRRIDNMDVSTIRNTTIPSISTNLGYKNLFFIYNDKKRAVNKKLHIHKDGSGDSGETEISSYCYFSLYAIKSYFTSKNQHFKDVWKMSAPSLAFDEDNNVSQTDLKNWLKLGSTYANGMF
uniref:ANF_receptor domain-containing protein n=1 Tax=Parastrongyloides trichosuri TaxID=131310 RepID=A0A0N4ZUD8_PARTI